VIVYFHPRLFLKASFHSTEDTVPAKTLTPPARAAARALGAQVAAARRRRRWTAERVAEQAAISLPTLRKVERGDPSVALGTALEVATLVGVPLFGVDVDRLGDLAGRLEDRLALLPARAVPLDDEGLDDAF
jgi:transcriptional regulator with XRE-family HTH domain